MKTKTPHTPGPWESDHNFIDAKKRTIASIRPKGFGNDMTAEDNANAALIAAAPELLAALERFVDNFSRFESPEKLKEKPGYEMYTQARAAIARAKAAL
jgi:hypothetical protein